MVMKYFMLVGNRPPYSLAALAAVTAFGVGTTEITPTELDAGLGMVLFVQMFVASSGFVVSARRGHYDPVLLHGINRMASVCPCRRACSRALPMMSHRTSPCLRSSVSQNQRQ